MSQEMLLTATVFINHLVMVIPAGSETMEVLDTLQPGDTVTFEGDRIRLKDKAGPTTSSVTISRVAPEATVGVREAVLWPGRPDMCRLAEDAQGLHLAATVNNEVVGVVSLFVDGAAARFRKFAVLEAHRGAGVGSRLLQAAEALEERAAERTRFQLVRENLLRHGGA